MCASADDSSPDDSQDKGRLLSAGYHNVMGYFRDDTPLMELILDEKGKQELNRLWDEFDFIADFTGAHLGAVLLQPERRSRRQGDASPAARGLGQGSQRRAHHLRTARRVSGQGRGRATIPSPWQAIRYHFQWVNDTLRSVERMRVGSRAPAPGRAARLRRARLPPAAVAGANVRGMLAFYRVLARAKAVSRTKKRFATPSSAC